MRLPQDTSDTKYVLSSWEAEITLADMACMAQQHFPAAELEDISISHQEIQIDCFGYDLYDSSDYRWYWVLCCPGYLEELGQ